MSREEKMLRTLASRATAYGIDRDVALRMAAVAMKPNVPAGWDNPKGWGPSMQIKQMDRAIANQLERLERRRHKRRHRHRVTRSRTEKRTIPVVRPRSRSRSRSRSKSRSVERRKPATRRSRSNRISEKLRYLLRTSPLGIGTYAEVR